MKVTDEDLPVESVVCFVVGVTTLAIAKLLEWIGLLV
jgi:hypothetical protein